MPRLLRAALLSAACALALAPGAAEGQTRAVVLVVDPGSSSVDGDRLTEELAGRLDRTVLRLTDPGARDAGGRLTLAFSAPDRWVLSFEVAGEIEWASEVLPPGDDLEARLATVVARLVAEAEAVPTPTFIDPWRVNGDLTLPPGAEIVDPFRPADALDVPSPPISYVWSEIIDPFAADDAPGFAPRGGAWGTVWSEVLDPWAEGSGR